MRVRTPGFLSLVECMLGRIRGWHCCKCFRICTDAGAHLIPARENKSRHSLNLSIPTLPSSPHPRQRIPGSRAAPVATSESFLRSFLFFCLRQRVLVCVSDSVWETTEKRWKCRLRAAASLFSRRSAAPHSARARAWAARAGARRPWRGAPPRQVAPRRRSPARSCSTRRAWRPRRRSSSRRACALCSPPARRGSSMRASAILAGPSEWRAKKITSRPVALLVPAGYCALSACSCHRRG